MTEIIDLSTPFGQLTKAFLEMKYIDEGLTCKEISEETGTARTTVLKYLKIHGIPVRSTGANQRRKRGVAYGSRIEKRKLITHKREMENIVKMRELRGRGFSYWKIADIFNSMKIPTKSGQGKWHAKSIQQILKVNCS